MADATLVRQVSKSIDLFKDEVPKFPEGLKVNPPNYTIYLDKKDWHPVSEAKPIKFKPKPPIVFPEKKD